MKAVLFVLYGLIMLGLYKGFVLDAQNAAGPVYAIYGSTVSAVEAYRVSKVPDKVVARQGGLWVRRIIKHATLYYYFSAWKKVCLDEKYRDYIFDLGSYVHVPEWEREEFFVYKFETKAEQYVKNVSETLLGKLHPA